MPKSHWIKIDRALDHINALDASIEAWRSENPYTVRKKREPYEAKDAFVDPGEGGWVRTSLRLHVHDAFPTEWSAFIGDAIHNLRASLDHMAFTLNANGYAKAHGGAALPPQKVKRSEFPIFGDDDPQGNPGKGADLFAEHGKPRLRFVDPAAVAIIERVQPYQHGQSFTTRPLWFIRDLDIIDKHQQVVLATIVPQSFKANRLVVEGPSLETTIAQPRPLDNDGELAYWITPPESKAHYDLELVCEVAFGHGAAPAGWPVIKTLRSLRDYVRKIASELDPHM